MSNRTALANKAIAQAWLNEQNLVSQGKGTRDWTVEQQKDILEKGKAYDENGRAFEGQHMKSVEAFPEYQSDPENIQFLTRDEHLDAHNGDWKNPTNWYYDPVTKEKHDFGSNKFEPCPVIQLSNPIVCKSAEATASSCEKETRTEEKESSDATKDKQGTQPPPSLSTPKTDSSASTHSVAKTGISRNNSGGRAKRFFSTIGKGVVKGLHFIAEHPQETIEVVGSVVGAVVAGVAASKGLSGKNSSSISNSTPQHTNSQHSNDSGLGTGMPNIVNTPNTYPDERSSPIPHEVSGHRQRYNTKEGPVWKDKAPYIRGGGKQ